jgi:cell division protein FtsB
MTYNSSAAPRLTAVPQRELPTRPNRHAAPAQPYLVPRKRPSDEQRKKAAKASRLSAVKIMVIAVLMLGMLSMLIFERAQLIKLNSARAVLEQELQEVRSDTVRLEAQFNSRVSVESVEEYAKKELGMVKQQKYQVHFFANDNEDEIVLLDGQTGE